ncbi:MAG: hypothetical protein PHC88_08150 [Terrimicrobiaceae bacterium]|nr:hypothetical protein [Terrimicrobiaceae bacterium]
MPSRPPSSAAPTPGRFAGLEPILAAVVAATALAHVALLFHALATTSLTTDEFGTIFSYSAKGPLHVATHYNAPKNHILFNLLNSILPGRESIEPLRARILSYLATIGVIGTMGIFAVRTRRYLESALWMAAWAGSAALIEMSLLARGYGLLCLAAALSCACTVAFFQTRRLGWCIALGGLTALGTYTVPGYLFFGGTLLLSIWLLDRRWPVFLVGVGAAASVLLLYAPVLTQLFHETHEFADKPQGDFQSVEGIFRALRVYGFTGPSWQSLLLFAGACLSSFAVPPGRPVAPALRALMTATLAFFGAMLFLQTPPLRMATCAMLPLAFCAVMAAGELLRLFPARPIVRLAAIAAALWFGARSATAVAHFSYTPIENWSLAAAAIDAAFPTTVSIDYGNSGKYLSYYLAPGRAVVKSAGTDFEESRTLIVDAHRIWANGARNDARDFEARRASSRGVELGVPGSIRVIAMNYAMPPGAQRPALAPSPGARGKFAGTFAISASAHSVVVFFDRAIGDAKVTAALGTDRSLTSLIAGNAVIVPLAGKPAGDLHIEVRTHDSQARPVATLVVPGQLR